jgi:hypothetical protein
MQEGHLNWRVATLLLGLGTGQAALAMGQTIRGPELGLQLTYWHLEGGGYDRFGPTAHLGIYLPGGTPIALRVISSYAPRGDLTPGLFAIGGQAAVRLLPAQPDTSRGLGVDVVLGYGGLRYSGTTGVELENPCGPAACIEGVFFRAGWAQVLELGLGLEIPLTSKLLAHPIGALLIPVGDRRGGPGHSVLRAGLGVGWR